MDVWDEPESAVARVGRFIEEKRTNAHVVRSKKSSGAGVHAAGVDGWVGKAGKGVLTPPNTPHFHTPLSCFVHLL